MPKKNKKFLIVSPHFPPINAADMHRVRTSIKYYRDYGWDPVVLTVLPEYVEGVYDKLLEKSLPHDAEIYKVSTLPQKLTKLVGISNLGLRSFPYLLNMGSRIISKHDIKMVFFSTTMSYTFLLGKMWKKKFNVPYIIDIQDPWYSKINYKENFKNKTKYQINRFILKYLESRIIPDVDGLISVSENYIKELESRYPEISVKPSKTITFGAADSDYNIVNESTLINNFFNTKNDDINCVYIGRGGTDMATAVKIICGALKEGLTKNEKLFRKLKLFFIGTSYSSSPEDKTIEPIAKEFGVDDNVFEYPERIPYFKTLKLMQDSDFIIVPGSNDSNYSASKLYPCILSKKPLICIFHKNSAVVDIVKKTKSGSVVTFEDGNCFKHQTKKLADLFDFTMKNIPFKPDTDWNNFENFSARKTAEQQCILFNDVCAGYQY